MSLAKKMFVKPQMIVRAVHLPADVNLDDVTIATDPTSWDVTLWFVASSQQLQRDLAELQAMWDNREVFWLFYPKRPHLDTDLGRDKVWALLNSGGIRGSRQVGIDDLWSCLYCKAK